MKKLYLLSLAVIIAVNASGCKRNVKTEESRPSEENATMAQAEASQADTSIIEKENAYNEYFAALEEINKDIQADITLSLNCKNIDDFNFLCEDALNCVEKAMALKVPDNDPDLIKEREEAMTAVKKYIKDSLDTAERVFKEESDPESLEEGTEDTVLSEQLPTEISAIDD